MARLWTSGFELQSATAAVEWQVVGGSPAISTSIKRSGAASLQISGLASGTPKFVLQRVNTTFSAYVVRFYLYYVTLPSAENTIFTFVNGITITAPSLNIRLQTDGSLKLYSDATVIGSASSALSANTWYRIEVRYSEDPAPGSQIGSARVDGSDFASSSALTLTDMQSIVLGGNLRSEAQTQGEWYVDDVAFNDSLGANQNSYPGAGSVVYMRPDATGDNNSGTLGGSAPAATTWESLDETTPNDGTDFVSFSNIANVLDVNCASAATAGIGASDTVTLVQVGLRWNATTAAACSSQLRIKSQASGTTATGTLTTTAVTAWHINDDTTPRNYKLTSYADPQAGGSWTPSLLDSMQIGIQTNDVTPNPEFSALWAVVDYVPAVGGGGGGLTWSPSFTMMGFQ
jgi:hypothetical protein